MPLELKFLIAGLGLTVVLGAVLIPILRKAMKEDAAGGEDSRGSR